MKTFDETTQQKAEEYANSEDWLRFGVGPEHAYAKGRNSARESLIIACRALEECADDNWYKNGFVPSEDEQVRRTLLVNRINDVRKVAKEALASIEARGDNPLKSESCCENEKRSIAGGCDSCGDPSF